MGFSGNQNQIFALSTIGQSNDMGTIEITNGNEIESSNHSIPPGTLEINDSISILFSASDLGQTTNSGLFTIRIGNSETFTENPIVFAQRFDMFSDKIEVFVRSENQLIKIGDIGDSFYNISGISKTITTLTPVLINETIYISSSEAFFTGGATNQLHSHLNLAILINK